MSNVNILFKTESIEATQTDDGFITFDCPNTTSAIRDLLLYIQRIEKPENTEGNLNGLRQAISLAMREGDKSVTISTEVASMIVVEYEKPRVAAQDAIDDKARMFSELEGAKRVANEQAAQNSVLREAIKFTIDPNNEPGYHDQGMGCGLEDRGITDRYEAMAHGWEKAMERVYSEVMPDESVLVEPPAAFLSEIQAQAIEEVAGIFHDGEYRNSRVIDILLKEATRIRTPLETKSRLSETQAAAQRILRPPIKEREHWVYTGTDAMFKDPEAKDHE